MVGWSSLTWLMKGEPDDPKHSGYLHSTLAFLISSVITNAVLIKLSKIQGPRHKKFAIFLGVYTFIVLLARIKDYKNLALYNMLWQCNISLVSTVLGLWLGKTDLTAAGVVGVSAVNTLWYPDIISLLIRGKFVVGAAGFLTAKETSFFTALTTLHHLWFIPVILYKVRSLPFRGFKLSVLMYLIMANFCRFFIPYQIQKDGRTHYMNVNMTYEAWKDVKYSFVRFADRNIYLESPWYVTFVALSVIWNSGNFAGYSLYKYLLKKWLEYSHK
jgi:hypothetical protein